jgi:hypothetical protein
MTNRSYQARGSVSRSVLITVRVSPEDRERLNQIAQERGETLSRMLVARWLPARKRATRQEPARRSEAIEPVVIGAPARPPKPSVSVRPDAERLRDATAPSVQGSLFDGMGGR